MSGVSVGKAASRTGWSARMLRYLEMTGLVVPARSPAGYRLYGVRELNQLQALDQLRRRFAVDLDQLRFVMRLRREPALRAAVETWLTGTDLGFDAGSAPAWVEWEQRKHERLLAA